MNFSHILECHETCAKCLDSSDADKCEKCKEGWTLNEETKLCEDINECLINEEACDSREFCTNTVGSYTCYECDPACRTACSGKGPDKCIGGCNKGYKLVDSSNANPSVDHCVDINECEEPREKPLCGDNLRCVNTPGYYSCVGTCPKPLDIILKLYLTENIFNNKNEGVDTQTDTKTKQSDLEKSSYLMRRSLVIGIGALCAVSSYFARQYILLVLSISFSLIVLYVLD